MIILKYLKLLWKIKTAHKKAGVELKILADTVVLLGKNL